MESEDSRSGSSSNESDNEDGRRSRSRAPSCPQSPGSETGRPDRYVYQSFFMLTLEVQDKNRES